jgi:hypothetical protein
MVVEQDSGAQGERLEAKRVRDMDIDPRPVMHKLHGVEGTATGFEGGSWWVEWEDGVTSWHLSSELYFDAFPVLA